MFSTWLDVQKVIAEARNRGAMMSNFFQTEGEFEVEAVGETTFLFKQEKGFKHLYFFTKSPEQLAVDLPALVEILSSSTPTSTSTSTPNFNFIVDVLGPDRIREPLENVFKDAGWEVLTVLQRMGRSQLKSKVEVEEGRVEVEGVKSNSFNSKLQLQLQPVRATAGDIPQVQAWLNEFFDAEQEQLPDARQIGKWVEKGTLLVTRGCGVGTHRPTDGGTISGFVAFDLSPAQLYLRYWFVHPSARGTGVGGKLLRAMFAAGSNTKRQYFWVKTDNENAIIRYQHYGFQFEPMKNTVLRFARSS